MQNTIFEYILNLFTGDDKLRPQFHTPFKIGEYVYATDAHALIKIPAKLLSRDYEVNEKAPKDLTSMYEGFTQAENIDIEFNIAVLSTLLADVKWTYMRTSCPKCKGASEILCDHCGHASPCEECDGTGMSYDMNFLIRKESEYAAVKFNGKVYRPFVLERLLITMMALKSKDFIVVHYDKNHKSLFTIGDVMVLLTQVMEQ